MHNVILRFNLFFFSFLIITTYTYVYFTYTNQMQTFNKKITRYVYDNIFTENFEKFEKFTFYGK